MAQLEASMSGVVLGGVVEIVGSNLARGKNLQHLSAQLIHFIPLYKQYKNKNKKYGEVMLQSQVRVYILHHMEDTIRQPNSYKPDQLAPSFSRQNGNQTH